MTALVLTVSAIAPEETGLARLGLNPTQQLPATEFVSLEELQSQTGLAAVARSRRNPIAKPARVNTLFFAMDPGGGGGGGRGRPPRARGRGRRAGGGRPPAPAPRGRRPAAAPPPPPPPPPPRS
jgi:hypothetical protein